MLNVISGILIAGMLNIFSFTNLAQKTIYRTGNGSLSILSEAPLETIKASSKELKGVIDTLKNTFAFSVAIQSIKGFNSPLQQQHFYENYMESSMYPSATFSGKIIENISYGKPGIYNIRAKGILYLHGVKSERLIRSTITIQKGEIIINSNFTINLQDHNIKIPRIVFQKISPEIVVDISANLYPVQI